MAYSRWGLGINYKKDGTISSYGYPESKNPKLFKPDFEVCTVKEITQWETDLINQDAIDEIGHKG